MLATYLRRMREKCSFAFEPDFAAPQQTISRIFHASAVIGKGKEPYEVLFIKCSASVLISSPFQLLLKIGQSNKIQFHGKTPEISFLQSAITLRRLVQIYRNSYRFVALLFPSLIQNNHFDQRLLFKGKYVGLTPPLVARTRVGNMSPEPRSNTRRCASRPTKIHG